MEVEFFYKPDNENPLSSNFNKYIELTNIWKKHESQLLGQMQKVWGVNFQRDIPTVVSEKLALPNYDRKKDCVNTCIMKEPERFVEYQAHELFHSLFNQNYEILSPYQESFRRMNKLSNIGMKHVYVYAGMKETMKNVFKNEAENYYKYEQWWKYPFLDREKLPEKDKELAEKFRKDYETSLELVEKIGSDVLTENLRSHVKAWNEIPK